MSVHFVHHRVIRYNRLQTLGALAWRYLVVVVLSFALAVGSTQVLAHPFGVHASAGKRPDAPGIAAALDAQWVRVNTAMDGDDPDFAGFLASGRNLLITLKNRDPANVDTTYGTLQQWPMAGFPFRSRAAYQQRLADILTPLLPYLAQGRQIWVQAENEIGDASLATDSIFWRGTTDQYLTLLAAFSEEMRTLSPSLVVVMTSFASPNLEVAIDPANPKNAYQTGRMTKLLTQGQYDAADGHFYGCAETMASRIGWLTSHLPPGKLWIASEISGPDSACPTTPHTWRENQAQFEQLEAQQVSVRLSACANAGGSVCLWFSLFDLTGEIDEYNHLGLLDPRVTPPRQKPAYAAFQAFVASRASGIEPVIEFYYSLLDHYFISADAAEIAALDGALPGGWTRTGQYFNAYPLANAGANPVCRFYLPPGFGDSHFYSASPAECGAVRRQYPQFILESTAVFYIALPDALTGACPSNSIPVYRVWNNRADSNHRYTTSRATRDQMIAKGYVAEGYGPDAVIMCSPAP